MGDGSGSPKDGPGRTAAGGGLVLSFQEAKGRKSTNPRARWSAVVDDLASELWPKVDPSFRLKPGQTVFTIGSCFARNIEANLAALGCRVPMLDLYLPPEEFDGQVNSAMNKFHPPAFRQCLEWAAAIRDRDGVVRWEDCEPLAFDVGDGRWFDLDLAPTVTPASRERFVERRQHVYDIVSTAFEAECLMMTPGLIEAWRDVRTGLYMYGAPYQRRMLDDTDRWVFEVLSFSRCLQDMLGAIDVVRARNPAVNVLVTTSPVPISLTFTGRDVTVANAHSKAVLRAVCDAVLFERERVDYFPSYEMATLSDPDLVWKADRLHVAQGFIGKIVGYMLDNYMEGVDAVLADYQRARALLAEGDAAEAVRIARGVLAARPDHLEARLLLGSAFVALRQSNEAMEVLRPALEVDRERADARVTMARAMAGAGRIQQAIDMADQAMALSSLTIGDFMALDGVLWRIPADAAVRIAERALELFPRHTQVYPRLAKALVNAGRTTDAIEALRRGAAEPHPSTELLVQLAELLSEAGETGEALARLDDALARNSRSKEAAALKARLLQTAPA